MTASFKKYQSPVGELTLVAKASKLIAVLWENDDPKRVKLSNMVENKKDPVLLECEKQLKEYFKGERNEFDLPLELVGTPFQKRVWRELQKIPFAKTYSYGQLAKKIRNPTAVRAVGGANGRNPLSIVVPCHRVIGANGKLTGFAGGLGCKEFLLKHEATQTQ